MWQGIKKPFVYLLVILTIFAIFILTLNAAFDLKVLGLEDRGPYLGYPGLIVAMAAGLFGATFSMLVQTQNRTSVGTLEDVEAAGSWYTLIMRSSVGVGAAAILYFFFESGLLAGTLWPDLGNLQFEALDSTSGQSQGNEASQRNRILPNKDWCLLVIWSVIAGFSENFVPTLLVRVQDKTTEAS